MGQNINLEIAKRKFQFNIDDSSPKNEQACRMAAQMISRSYEALKSKAASKDTLDILAILLFNYAKSLASVMINEQEDTFLEELTSLSEHLNSYIVNQPLQQQYFCENQH